MGVGGHQRAVLKAELMDSLTFGSGGEKKRTEA